MVWFSLRKLEEKIALNQLTENDGYKYFLATAIFIAVQEMYNSRMGFNSMIFLHDIISLAFTVVGILITYEINNSIDGKDYLKRIISVTWMIKLRVLVLYIITLKLYMFYVKLNGSSFEALIFQFLITIGLCTYSLITSLQSFKRIKERKLQWAAVSEL